MIRVLISGSVAALFFVAGAPSDKPFAQAPSPKPQVPFDVYEKSIAELQAALEKRQVTSRQLVERYLARIDAFEQQGPGINAFISLNPAALETADALDRERAARKVRGPLHGIPVVIKDNFDTADMPTTGSSIALATYRPARDAFQVARLRDAGAIVVGKTNLHELASGIVTVSSLGAQTRNPYDPARNPGGSSGGTAAAIAASFAAAGLGTDTCGSIRIPAAHNSLVGLRPSAGLSSRAGVIPLSHTQDVAGPLARTVRDVAVVLDATVGVDPADPATTAGRGRAPRSYLDGLGTSTLANVRLGLLTPLFGDMPDDDEVGRVVRASLDTATARGAVLVDIPMPNLTELLRATSVIDAEFKFDLADYLSAASNPPVRSLGEILERGLYHQALDAPFRRRNGIASRDSESYRAALAKRDEARKAILAAMDAERVSALVYPTIRRKAALVGEAQGGSNCQLSPTTGLPALSMPAGFTPDGLPVGVEFVGRPFSEPDLLKLGSAFERATRARRPPASTPPLTGRPLRPTSPSTASTQPTPEVVARFRQPGPNTLAFEVTVEGVKAEDMLLVALHRTPATPAGSASDAVKSSGFLIGRLLRTGELTGRGEIALRVADREDLAAGRLSVRLFTRQRPFGDLMQPVVLQR
jgi:Asp-tRNA(Asn)/Glu-tRNA(Gln) amidotransferase A subunit family amidase